MATFFSRFPWLTWLALMLVAVEVLAQDSGAAGYETQSVLSAMADRGLVRDEQPEGKTIIAVEIDRHEVFQRGEFWPDIVTVANGLHAVTEEVVVRRNLLFDVGDRYSTRLVEETMRNLRRLQIFSLVRIEAIQTSDPALVKVFVYTRDLWSLRLESEFRGAGSNLHAVGQLTERNLLGKNKLASIRAGYQPILASAGQSYRDYRVFGNRLQLQEDGNLYYNYRTKRLEGGVIAASLGRPYYQLDQTFAFDFYVRRLDWMHRDLAGTNAARVDLTNGTPASCDVALPSCARSVYRERQTDFLAEAHYRIGQSFKHTFTGGAGYGNHFVQARPESAVGANFSAAFSRYVLPLPRRVVYPFASYRLFGTDYAKFRNLGSFAVTETVRRGPALLVSTQLPLAALGSTYNALRLDGRFDFVWARHDALLDVMIAAGTRREQHEFRDQLLSARIRGATPPWFAGRLVGNALWEGRDNDRGRTFVSLGADNGLRGFPVAAVRAYGANRVLVNAEYRTLPLDLASLHVGAVVFFDSGSVYGQGIPFRMRHSAGVGLRFLIPQLNVYPWRLDFGTALGGSSYSVLLSYGSSQAVPLTAIEDALADPSATPL